MISQLSILDIGKGLHVRRIEYQEAIPFLLEIHYARRIPSITDAFGLFKENQIIGIVTYGVPASPNLCFGIAGKENAHHVKELNRLVIKPEFNNRENFASYLVSHSLRMLDPGTYVVSYADWGGWHHVGYVYQATNFLYTGMTKERTDIFSESGHSRHYDKSEIRRQIRTAKYRYVYLVGTKRDKARMMKDLNYPIIHEYPKGVSERYDTNNPVAVSERGKHERRTVSKLS